MRIPVIALALMWISGVADAAVPLPRVRPVEAKPHPAPAIVPAPSADAVKAGEVDTVERGEPERPGPSACQIALAHIATFKPLPPIEGKDRCGITDPVLLEAALLPDGAAVALDPPATLRCDMAAAVAQWLRQDVAKSAAQLGAALAGIVNFDSYECRSRNRVSGAKMSEHGRGNALDVKAVKLASGEIAQLTDPRVAKQVREDLRKATCARFTTVLGPGADGHHEHHIHVDLAQRRSGYRLCQWDVRVPLEGGSPSPHVVFSRTSNSHEPMISVPGAKPDSRPAMLPRPRPERRSRAMSR